MRLFACCELIRLAASYPATFSGESDTVAQFVASAVALGPAAARGAAGVLAWRFLAHPGQAEDPAFLSLAILLLAAHLERGEERGPWLKSLAAWVVEHESHAREMRSVTSGGDEWLMGLTFYSVRDSVWRSLAERILARPETPHPRDADEDLRLIGELVARI
jgi:hypothetical protein